MTDGTNSATYSYVANPPLIAQLLFKQNSNTRMTTIKSNDFPNRLLSVSNVLTGGASAESPHFKYALSGTARPGRSASPTASSTTAPQARLFENSILVGTGHGPVAMGYQPAASFGGKLPPKTRWQPVPPIFSTGTSVGCYGFWERWW